MSRHFCCCIPVRFGVFIVSLLVFILSTVGSAALWWVVAHPNDPNAPDKSMRTAIIFAGVHFTIVALASFVGFIGACGRKRSLVAFYSVFLWISVLINLGLGIYYVYQTVHNFDNGVNSCKAAAKNAVDGSGSAKDVGKVCLSRPLTIGLSIGVFIIELLLMLYFAVIVGRYKHQLEDEDRWDAGLGNKNADVAPASRAPAPMLMSQQPSAYGAGYPYAQQQNSYGNDRAV